VGGTVLRGTVLGGTVLGALVLYDPFPLDDPLNLLFAPDVELGSKNGLNVSSSGGSALLILLRLLDFQDLLLLPASGNKPAELFDLDLDLDFLDFELSTIGARDMVGTKVVNSSAGAGDDVSVEKEVGVSVRWPAPLEDLLAFEFAPRL